MSLISDVVSSAQAQAKQVKAEDTKNTAKKSNVKGKTVGEPKLSDKAAKYYEDLKKKYSGMEFILVSRDQKAFAQSQAASYANPAKMVVLIDEDKIERMATDESYRKQYEGIIANAASGMSQLSKSLSGNSSVKGYGMKVNGNGTASFFAVIDKSLAAQRKRIEKKAQEKKEAKKAEEKRAKKKEQQEKLEESWKKDSGKTENLYDEDTVTVQASSIEELLKKINDVTFESMSDYARTEEEKKIGQSFDFSI
ncbi:MAG: hypothetical protein HFI77_11805 [Lachnospiraceae bacterium]|jgi:hypothetical protein|uniref:DUF6033 family protein n=1 Tax=Roseburia sp. 1XD42-69 TaxID=2320088 RepID=UPI000EA0543B|nr:DUF6033 family protein [Roseburia sp. 1XD42-69]MCI8876680.1 hypothetical protein [Lachnospiraceae bacterium]RKJ62118.1 hypothetical protein D7Y06_18265 [Roseburia sp. 1XD42-69]